jgi:hypothetical protein
MGDAERKEDTAGDLGSRWIAMVNKYSTDEAQRVALIRLDDNILIEMVMNCRNALQFIAQLELTDEDRFRGRDISNLEQPYNFIVDLLTERVTRGRTKVGRAIDMGRGDDLWG